MSENASAFLGFIYIAGFILVCIIIFVIAMKGEPARARKRIERAMEAEMITGIAHQEMQERVAQRVRRAYRL